MAYFNIHLHEGLEKTFKSVTDSYVLDCCALCVVFQLYTVVWKYKYSLTSTTARKFAKSVKDNIKMKQFSRK